MIDIKNLVAASIVRKRNGKSDSVSDKNAEFYSAGTQVAYCPKCKQWYNIEKIMQMHCPQHGDYMKDRHTTIGRLRKLETRA